jgi:hypothetical protein
MKKRKEGKKETERRRNEKEGRRKKEKERRRNEEKEIRKEEGNRAEKKKETHLRTPQLHLPKQFRHGIKVQVQSWMGAQSPVSKKGMLSTPGRREYKTKGEMKVSYCVTTEKKDCKNIEKKAVQKTLRKRLQKTPRKRQRATNLCRRLHSESCVSPFSAGARRSRSPPQQRIPFPSPRPGQARSTAHETKTDSREPAQTVTE